MRRRSPDLAGDDSSVTAGLYDRQTAVYDISARTVYLPDGTTLEAHSGYHEFLDDTRYARVRNRGVTPPDIYNLEPRERLFHGVQALRLIPVDGQGIRTQRPARPHLHARPERRLQRLRVVQGLRRIPQRL